MNEFSFEVATTMDGLRVVSQSGFCIWKPDNTINLSSLKTSRTTPTSPVPRVSPRSGQSCFWLMQFHPRGILLKWLPICPHIKRLRNVSLGLLRLFWCAFKQPVCVEGAHSQLAGTQWLHLSLKVNTRRGGPQIWPFQMPKPPRLSILCDNEQIPIQKHLLCDSMPLWCLQHTWANDGTTSLWNKAGLEL